MVKACFFCFFIVLATSVGCGRVNNNTYDQSCQVDEDCQIVYLAEDCTCDNLMSVNVSEVEQVREDNDRVERRQFCPGGVTECDVAYSEARCEMGTCGFFFPDEETMP